MKNIKRMICMVLAALCLLAFCACNTEENGDDGQAAKEGGIVLGFEYKGTKIALGDKADAIIEKLGEPQSRTEIGNCGGLGAQVRYLYPSVELDVLESKTEGNIIDAITFRDDIVTTTEGVYIGMGAEEALSKCGEGAVRDGDEIKYTDGKYALIITIADNKVSEIDYITNSLSD